MSAITPTLTTAGIQAVFNATNTGLQAEVTHIALGDSGYTPTDAATALVAETQRVAVSGGELIGTNQIHLTASASGASEYWIREVGFYLSDGTLLAVYSHPTNAIAHKSSTLDILLSFDLLLSALPASSITINGTGGLSFPAATNTKQGIMRFATDVEAANRTNVDAAVQPHQITDSLPIGSVLAFAAETAPTGFLICNGATINRTSYADLFAIIGTIYGVGDGSTSFILPDLRGEFLRGFDGGRGIDAARDFGSAQNHEINAHQHSSPISVEDGREIQGNVPTPAPFGLGGLTGDARTWAEVTDTTDLSGDSRIVLTSSTGGAETRPRNIALNFIIKY